MKTLLRKSDNEVFDNLLRSHIKRSAARTPACPEFDPDRANAYVERAISGIERTQYERHLSECAGCRTSVVALARMAEAAGPLTSPAPEIRNLGNRDSSWLTSFKAGLLAVASPRWAIVATTLLVIGISLPLALRNERPQLRPEAASTPDVATAQPDAATAQSEERQYHRSQQQEPGTGGAGKLKAQPVGLVSKPAERGERRGEIAAGDFSKAAETTSAVAVNQPAAEAAERKKAESADPGVPRDDAKLRDALDKVAASAVAPPAPQVKSSDEDRARISKNDVLTLPREDPSATKVKTLKPGAPDPGLKTEREKEVIAAIRSKDGEAPPKRRAAGDAESRAALASGPRGRALVGGSEGARTDRSHSQEKTVGKKTFWLTRGVWTDADYNSDRKLPVVTVVRDSDVYKEMLEKNNKLKVFFAAFAVSDRAIIVFKNTVYNLIPQADGK